MRNGSSISLLMLDIDYFKLYNDTYGHQGGDSCLKIVANILKDSENRPADLAARYGGEEFCIVLPETTEQGVKDISYSVLDRLRKTTIPHKSSKVSDYLSASIGTATFIPGRDTNPDKIIEIADQALYKAKNEGRDRIVTTAQIKG